MIDWILKGLGAMLYWFSSWSGSYAIALLFYALIFKVLLSFFSIKQQKNQIAMAKLAPKMAVIREKYRGRTDAVTMRKQQEEMMELQRKEGYSPLSGCLPLLIQLPIIILLYNVIQSPLSFLMNYPDELVINLWNLVHEGVEGFKAVTEIGAVKQIELIGLIKDSYASGIGAGALEHAYVAFDAFKEIPLADTIAALPNFDLWGLNLALTPSFNPISWLVVIPFIAAGFQWLTMFITRKLSGNSQMAGGGDEAQAQMSLKIMDLVMPLMTLFIAFGFSAMLGLYWIYQSILGILQSFILHKVMPIPKYTEEELKAMRKAKKAEEKAQKNAIKAQPKYKSLHYIDEDDYEELPEIKTSNQGKKPMGGSGDRPEIKD